MSTADKAQVGYFELLRNNSAFRGLWLSRVISQVGDGFTAIRAGGRELRPRLHGLLHLGV